MDRSMTAAANWGRYALLAGGGLLAVQGLRRGGWAGAALTAAGAGLLASGVANEAVRERLHLPDLRDMPATQPKPVTIRHSVTIAKPREELYRFWRDFTNLSRIMTEIDRIDVRDPRHSHWVVNGPGGAKVAFDAEVDDDRENERIAWRSVGDAQVHNSGWVAFADAPAGRGVDRLMRAQGLGVSVLAPRAAGSGAESKATRQARRTEGVFDARVPLRDERAMPDFMRWPDEGVNPLPNPAADPGHPLFGQTVVFTGGIGMSRQSAKTRAAAHGAQTANRVGAATTMLVVGDGFEAADLHRPRAEDGAPQAVTTALAHRKTRDALRRRDRGQAIALVSEGEFLQMLDGNWPDAAR